MKFYEYHEILRLSVVRWIVSKSIFENFNKRFWITLGNSLYPYLIFKTFIKKLLIIILFFVPFAGIMKNAKNVHVMPPDADDLVKQKYSQNWPRYCPWKKKMSNNLTKLRLCVSLYHIWKYAICWKCVSTATTNQLFLIKKTKDNTPNISRFSS